MTTTTANHGTVHGEVLRSICTICNIAIGFIRTAIVDRTNETNVSRIKAIFHFLSVGILI